MYAMVHGMRTRIIKVPAFDSGRILGAILFENTMERSVDGQYTADYLWEKKGIVPFLKVDQGLAPLENGVQLMKPIAGLDDLLSRAVGRNLFGTKNARLLSRKRIRPAFKAPSSSSLKSANKSPVSGSAPIIEPEVDIHSADKAESEKILKAAIIERLASLADAAKKVMLKLSIPTEDDFYAELIADPHVVRVVALSGGYSRAVANGSFAQSRIDRELLARVVAGAKRRSNGRTIQRDVSDIDPEIYEASIT